MLKLEKYNDDSRLGLLSVDVLVVAKPQSDYATTGVDASRTTIGTTFMPSLQISRGYFFDCSVQGLDLNNNCSTSLLTDAE